MTTATTAPLVPHAASCKRPAPTLRLSWQQLPELFCSGCGRAALLPRPVADEGTNRHNNPTND